MNQEDPTLWWYPPAAIVFALLITWAIYGK